MEQIEKPTISILVVDDEIDAMYSDLKFIEQAVKNMDYDYKQYDDPDGSKAVSLLSENLIDIVVTDKNLIYDTLDGIAVVKKIREHNPFVDILFYSGQGITDDEKKEISKFHYVEIVDDKDISNELHSLIKKNMAKWDDISYLRGVVISLIIILEGQLHDFILKYYKISKEDHVSFKTYILENRNFSFEGKKWALSKLIKSKDYPNLLKNLEELQTARNELAHSHLHKTKRNCLKVKDIEKIISKDTVINYYKQAKSATKQLENLFKNTKDENSLLNTEQYRFNFFK